MPFVIEVLEEDRLILARLSGPCTVDETHAVVAAIKSRIGTYPVEGVLLDLREVDYSSDLDEAFDFAADEFVSFLGRRRLAFVTTSPVHYGMARMICRRAEAEGVEIDVFADENAALAWLHSSDTSRERHEMEDASYREQQRVAGTTGRDET
jgi:hypothetical protein